MLTESASQYVLFMKDLNNHCILNVGQVELKASLRYIMVNTVISKALYLYFNNILQLIPSLLYS